MEKTTKHETHADWTERYLNRMLPNPSDKATYYRICRENPTLSPAQVVKRIIRMALVETIARPNITL